MRKREEKRSPRSPVGGWEGGVTVVFDVGGGN